MHKPVLMKGVRLCNQYRVDEVNDRIYARNVPSSSPQMQFDPRPTPTKYCTPFPKTPLHETSATPVACRPSFDPSKAFLPGDSAPFSGFDVNKESMLKNINFALQKAPQAAYVPPSTSDMYAPWTTRTVLASNATAQTQKPAPLDPTQSIFYNDTRQQVKEMKPVSRTQ